MTIKLEMSIVKLVSIIRSNPDGGRRRRKKRVKKEEREREHQKGKYNLENMIGTNKAWNKDNSNRERIDRAACRDK